MVTYKVFSFLLYMDRILAMYNFLATANKVEKLWIVQQGLLRNMWFYNISFMNVYFYNFEPWVVDFTHLVLRIFIFIWPDEVRLPRLVAIQDRDRTSRALGNSYVKHVKNTVETREKRYASRVLRSLWVWQLVTTQRKNLDEAQSHFHNSFAINIIFCS
jgi:hypothetical protein